LLLLNLHKPGIEKKLGFKNKHHELLNDNKLSGTFKNILPFMDTISLASD